MATLASTTPEAMWVLWGIVGLSAWGLLCAVAFYAGRLPRPSDDDTFGGVVSVVLRAYCRIFHAMKVEGELAETIRASRAPGRGLLVVCNHTAGVDPLLVQTALPFYVRWMMARDMIHPRLAFVFEWLRVIEVDRTGNDRSSVREAVRALRAGEAVGIFPEGRIGREAGKVLAFLPGAGVIAHMSGCDILPVAIVGTPAKAGAFGSLLRPSKSRVRLLAVVRAEELPGGAKTMAELERRIGAAVSAMQG